MPEQLDRARELDLDWVTDRIALGGRIWPGVVARLADELRIGGVVDLRLEDRDDEALLGRHGIALLHLPTVDGRGIPRTMLEEGVAWVHSKLATDRRVLIHCQHGIGRSALLTCCVLVSRGLSPLEALRLAKSARARVSPSPEQLETFIEWARDWRASRQAPWAVPGFEELARIAYSHLISSQ